MGHTTAEEIRRRRQAEYTITLPHSGVDVTVREVDVMDLAAAGGIPDTLTHHVWDDFQTLSAGTDGRRRRELMDERAQVLALVCCAMLVEPRMVMHQAGAGELVPTDLPYVDREFLWQVACGQGRLPDLHRFREQQAGAVAAAQDGGDVLGEAVDTARAAGD